MIIFAKMFTFVKTVLIAVIFLGPLIFFHELGHFLFCRLFGVKVEVFSLGFGKKLFRKKIGDTEYTLSIIPFGGYVKMFGDDPQQKDSISEEDKKCSFLHQSKWARFWIVFGGPLANFILAFCIFFSLLLIGERVPEMSFGDFSKSNIFYSKGVLPGDVLKKIDGKDIYYLSDIAILAGTDVDSITVRRSDKMIELPLDMQVLEFLEGFRVLPRRLYRKLFVVDKSGTIFKLGFKPDGIDTVTIQSLEDISRRDKIEGLISIYDEKGKEVLKSFNVNCIGDECLAQFFKMNDLRPVDLIVKSVVKKFPAETAGIRSGDVISTFDGVDLFSFEDLKSNLQKTDSKSSIVTVWRGGKILTFDLVPNIIKSETISRKQIGVESGIRFFPSKINMVVVKSKGFFNSLYRAWQKTVGSAFAIIDGVKKLITGQVSMENIGGPIKIAEVARDSFDMSLSYFFQLMALISVNLGIINLFPIPILDGGHLMFLLIEFVNRGPISRKKMEIAQQVGLSILLLLMFLTILNDIVSF